jgi:hypothetical protein
MNQPFTRVKNGENITRFLAGTWKYGPGKPFLRITAGCAAMVRGTEDGGIEFNPISHWDNSHGPMLWIRESRKHKSTWFIPSITVGNPTKKNLDVGDAIYECDNLLKVAK